MRVSKQTSRLHVCAFEIANLDLMLGGTAVGHIVAAQNGVGL
jgi:hypothetical protein